MDVSVWLAIIAALSNIPTYLIGTRKRKVDRQAAEIENLSKIAAEWRQTAEHWKGLADEYQRRFMDAVSEMEGYKETARKEIDSLKSEIKRLKRSLPAT